MTLNDVYRRYLAELKEICSPGEASNITAIIFESFAGLSKSDVIKDPSRLVEKPLADKLCESLQELLNHRPVQYITGEAWFCKMKLKVNESVLIPRPETEELVMAVIESVQPVKSVLDIGTGSGCIAIAIQKNTDAYVTAIDLSKAALSIAAENAASQKALIDFLELDFLDEGKWPLLNSYDSIVSNPPYIPETEKEWLDKNVTEYEPHLALFVAAAEPIIFYKKIAAFGKTHLNAGGKIFMETHEEYAKKVAMHFQEQGYDVVIRKDMFEKERIVIAGFAI